MKRIHYLFLLLLCAGLLQSTIGAEIPRPEHPMPQVERAEWLNLNGTWDFAETNDSNVSFLQTEKFPESITVPFCRESKLSGIGRTGFMKNVWYRRTFTVPKDWKSPRILLHIGASDYLTKVWINGKPVGEHRGGYVQFGFDISSFLKENENTVIIHAYDDSAGGLQPLGKQSRQEKSEGIFYTRTTGIWQTVWLEGVGQTYITDFHVTPDPKNSRILLQAETQNNTTDVTINATAFANGKPVGEASVPVTWRNNYLTIDLKEKNLWSLENPFLYDLKLTLTQNGKVIDEIKSYFGLRSVDIQGAAILINGQPVFQRLVLDQGFNPEGIWNSPTDEFLKHDIELSKAVGFNGARLHQKVFEPRFLYWADKLGYLVWGEYPSYGADYDKPVVDVPFMQEWVEIVRRDRNHPSIIGWCPFNETPKEAGNLQNTVVTQTRAMDPSRPVLDTSGWAHSLVDPELSDAHDYNQDPVDLKKHWMEFFTSESLPPQYGNSVQNIPFYISEFGGIGWFESSGEAWGYGNRPKTLDEFYTRFEGLANALMDNPNLFGFCYTQLTDIEQERNGIYKYDRTPKFDAQKLHAILSRKAAYETNPPLQRETKVSHWKILIGSAQDTQNAKPWRNTIEKPADNWIEPAFDDSSWKSSSGGFGKKDGVQDLIHTPWDTKNIWLRQSFECDDASFTKAILFIHYDNDAEVFLNGKKLWSQTRWNDQYQIFDVTAAAKDQLAKGKNTIAVHCKQDTGGQYIDLAFLVQ